MSYQEKRTVVTILAEALILGAYCVYAFGRYRSGVIDPNDLKSSAILMLAFIGISIIAMIAIQIVFHILLSISIAVVKKIQDQSADEQEIDKTIDAEFVEDEMDRLIELKSARIGFYFAGAGFVAALVSLALNYAPVVMLNIVFIAFSAGTIVEGTAQLYYYRKGLNHA
jgi:hypothetical protein